jgi:hypothetical protein
LVDDLVAVVQALNVVCPHVDAIRRIIRSRHALFHGVRGLGFRE